MPHPIPPIMSVISRIMARELYSRWVMMQMGMLLGFVTTYPFDVRYAPIATKFCIAANCRDGPKATPPKRRSHTN